MSFPTAVELLCIELTGGVGLAIGLGRDISVFSFSRRALLAAAGPGRLSKTGGAILEVACHVHSTAVYIYTSIEQQYEY